MRPIYLLIMLLFIGCTSKSEELSKIMRESNTETVTIRAYGYKHSDDITLNIAYTNDSGLLVVKQVRYLNIDDINEITKNNLFTEELKKYIINSYNKEIENKYW